MKVISVFLIIVSIISLIVGFEFASFEEGIFKAPPILIGVFISLLFVLGAGLVSRSDDGE